MRKKKWKEGGDGTDGTECVQLGWERRLEEARSLVKVVEVVLEERIGVELEEGDARFLTDIREKIEMYGKSAQISERQLVWMRRIRDKVMLG